jgi:sortase (surface protein transpeptidase)
MRLIALLLALLGLQGVLFLPAQGQVAGIEPVHIVSGEYDTAGIEAAGWLDGTALPGQWGRVGLIAHSFTIGAAWYSIERGDPVLVLDARGLWRYTAYNGLIVDVSQKEYLTLPVGAESDLIMITCYGDRRVIIFAQ